MLESKTTPKVIWVQIYNGNILYIVKTRAKWGDGSLTHEQT
jgi:hypothetical protein